MKDKLLVFIKDWVEPLFLIGIIVAFVLLVTN